jgi:hypothetical protein
MCYNCTLAEEDTRTQVAAAAAQRRDAVSTDSSCTLSLYSVAFLSVAAVVTVQCLSLSI